MSLDKAIKYGKEKRKPYEGGKAYAKSCRNHGICSFCEGNRRFKFRDKHPYNLKEEEDYEEIEPGNETEEDDAREGSGEEDPSSSESS